MALFEYGWNGLASCLKCVVTAYLLSECMIPGHIFPHNLFLQEYSKLQVTKPKIREGMELVEQPTDDLFPCSCHRKSVRNTDRLLLGVRVTLYFFILIYRVSVTEWGHYVAALNTTLTVIFKSRFCFVFLFHNQVNYSSLNELFKPLPFSKFMHF